MNSPKRSMIFVDDPEDSDDHDDDDDVVDDVNPKNDDDDSLVFKTNKQQQEIHLIEVSNGIDSIPNAIDSMITEPMDGSDYCGSSNIETLSPIVSLPIMNRNQFSTSSNNRSFPETNSSKLIDQLYQFDQLAQASQMEADLERLANNKSESSKLNHTNNSIDLKLKPPGRRRSKKLQSFIEFEDDDQNYQYENDDQDNDNDEEVDDHQPTNNIDNSDETLHLNNDDEEMLQKNSGTSIVKRHQAYQKSAKKESFKTTVLHSSSTPTSRLVKNNSTDYQNELMNAFNGHKDDNIDQHQNDENIFQRNVDDEWSPFQYSESSNSSLPPGTIKRHDSDRESNHDRRSRRSTTTTINNNNATKSSLRDFETSLGSDNNEDDRYQKQRDLRNLRESLLDCSEQEFSVNSCERFSQNFLQKPTDGIGNFVDDQDEDDGDSNEDILFDRLKQMEQEQDLLNNSLLALTSHFAQVQLRLRQIVEAKDLTVDKRETLLAELENFANRGIPELILFQPMSSGSNLERSTSMATSLMIDDVFEDEIIVDSEASCVENSESTRMATNHHHHHQQINSKSDGQNDDDDRMSSNKQVTSNHHHHQKDHRTANWSCNSQTDIDSVPPSSTLSKHNSTSTTMLITEDKLERQRTRQKELINQLKEQLEDLERYAYETGEMNCLPSSMLLERQNAIIEQLKSKLPVLSIDEIDKLSPEELRHRVDHAVKELVNPGLMKEQLVCQLKTQVTDLERFIYFLQQEKHQLSRNRAQRGSSASSWMGKLLMKKDSQNRTSLMNELRRPKCDLKNNTGHSTTINQEIDSEPSKQSLHSFSKKMVKKSLNNRSKMDKTNVVESSKVKSTDLTNGGGETSTEATNIIKRILSLLQVFAWTQIGTCASFMKYSDNNNGGSNHDPRHYHQNQYDKPPLSNHHSNHRRHPHHHRAPFEQNILKRTSATCGRHWGDLRAHLEMAIETIISFYKENNLNHHQQSGFGGGLADGDDYGQNDETEDGDFISLGSTAFVINNYFAYEQMTMLIRKELAIALRNLIQHGLIGGAQSSLETSLGGGGGDSLISTVTTGANANNMTSTLISMSLGCFSNRSSPAIKSGYPMHVWELILYYYNLKNGSKFRSTPARRLSQSFGLQITPGTAPTNAKHSLLAAIDEIIDSHTRFKRSLDSHWKAFVCLALNQRMLFQWLKLILKNSTIVNDCYEKWSYTSSTGFDDALRQLDRLSSLRFCLPTNLAVRQLQSIHDAF